MRARGFSRDGPWARCARRQPWLIRDTGPVRSDDVSRPRSARVCDVAPAALRIRMARKARWARRGRSCCCGGSGASRERTGRAGSRATADRAGRDRAAACRGGVARGCRTRGSALGADSGNAGHGQASGRLLPPAAAGYAESATLPDACPSSCSRPTLRISLASRSVQPRGFASNPAWRLSRPYRHRPIRAGDPRTSIPACRPVRKAAARRWPRRLRPPRSLPGGSPLPATSE